MKLNPEDEDARQNLQKALLQQKQQQQKEKKDKEQKKPREDEKQKEKQKPKEEDKNNQPKNILINGKAFDNNKVYYVVTSDYLSNGGDNMIFFKKGVAQYDLNYKLRNIIIDYFKENKIITANKDIRISKE